MYTLYRPQNSHIICSLVSLFTILCKVNDMVYSVILYRGNVTQLSGNLTFYLLVIGPSQLARVYK